MNGVAVHAVQGERQRYAPLSTPLCASSDPQAVVDAFLGLYPFRRFYLADLNALMGTGDNEALIAALLTRYPEQQFWVDCGLSTVSFSAALARNRIRVIGSESLPGDGLARLAEIPEPWILSLDFMADVPLGPRDLFDRSHYWPRDIIIMTLARVGGEQGPDWRRIGDFRQGWPHKNFVAAGGVRDERDLIRLRDSGIRQVLIASALHARRIDPYRIGE